MKYENCFPVIYKNNEDNRNKGITKCIRISCKCNQSLHLLAKESDNHLLKVFYKKYSIILGTVIKEAKKLYYYELIDKSENKVRTTWKVIKKET
jgi:hypothetical protein